MTYQMMVSIIFFFFLSTNFTRYSKLPNALDIRDQSDFSHDRHASKALILISVNMRRVFKSVKQFTRKYDSLNIWHVVGLLDGFKNI